MNILMGIIHMNNPYEMWVRETREGEFRAKVSLGIGIRLGIVKFPSAGEAMPNLTY